MTQGGFFARREVLRVLLGDIVDPVRALEAADAVRQALLAELAVRAPAERLEPSDDLPSAIAPELAPAAVELPSGRVDRVGAAAAGRRPRLAETSTEVGVDGASELGRPRGDGYLRNAATSMPSDWLSVADGKALTEVTHEGARHDESALARGNLAHRALVLELGRIARSAGLRDPGIGVWLGGELVPVSLRRSGSSPPDTVGPDGGDGDHRAVSTAVRLSVAVDLRPSLEEQLALVEVVPCEPAEEPATDYGRESSASAVAADVRDQAEPVEAADSRGAWQHRIASVASAVIATSIALLLFVCYTFYGTALLEGRAQRAFDRSTHVALRSPDIGLDEVLLGSDSRQSLTKGPGFVPGLGVPGSATPIVLVGHRTIDGAPFRHLNSLKPGSQVELVKAGITYTYSVERLESIPPSGAIQVDGGAQPLLLVTAAPAYQQSRRLVVVARLVEPGGATRPPQTIHLPRLSGSSLDMVLAVVVLALLGSYSALRRTRVAARPWTVRWLSLVPMILLTALSCHFLMGSLSRVI